MYKKIYSIFHNLFALLYTLVLLIEKVVKQSASSSSSSNTAFLADEEFRSSIRNRLLSHDTSPSCAPPPSLRAERFGARDEEDDGEEHFVDQPPDEDEAPPSRRPKLQPSSADGAEDGAEADAEDGHEVQHASQTSAGPLFELLLLQRHYAPSVALLASRELAAPIESKSRASEPV